MTNNNNLDKKQCSRCKVRLPLTEFRYKRTGDMNKSCNSCIATTRRFYYNNKCLHGIYIYNCSPCLELKKQSKKDLKKSNSIHQ